VERRPAALVTPTPFRPATLAPVPPLAPAEPPGPPRRDALNGRPARLAIRYSEFVVRRPWFVLLASLAASALVAFGMTRLTVDLDFEKQLPSNDSLVSIDRAIRKDFGGSRFVSIAVVVKSGTIWRAPVLHLVHDLTLDLANARGVIRRNVLSLSAPGVRVPEERDGVLKDSYLMKEVPDDETGIQALRGRYLAEPTLKDLLVSPDERAAMIAVDFYDYMDPSDIAETIYDAIDKYRSADVQIAVSGAPIIHYFEAKVMRAQAFYFLGTIAAICVVLYLAFGQLQGLVLPTSTALLSTLWAMGLMGFAGISLDTWTTAVPVVVLTVATGHATQMLKRYYEELRRNPTREAALVASTSRMAPVMLAAGGTAALGFAVLTILGIPALTNFGVGVAGGILAAVVLELTFMLALRAVWAPARAGQGEGPLSRWLGLGLGPLARMVSTSPGGVLCAFAAVTLLASAGLGRLTTELSPRTYWPPTSEVGSDLKVFDDHFEGTTTLNVLLEGDVGAMAKPPAIRLMADLEATMRADPDVTWTYSLADVAQRTYETWAPEDASKGLPDDQRTVAQIINGAASPPENVVNPSQSRAVVRALLTRPDSAIARRVMERLKKRVAEERRENIRVGIAGGEGPMLVALNDHTVSGKVLNIVMLLVAIYVIASVLLRTPLGGAYVIAPLVVTLLVNLGLFSWLGIAFDLSGASIAAVGIGIGSDYAIYFLYRLREEFAHTGDIHVAVRETAETSGRAIVFVAMAISAGFGVYAISSYYPLRICGLFVPATMLVSCLSALTVVPALALTLRPRFVFET